MLLSVIGVVSNGLCGCFCLVLLLRIRLGLVSFGCVFGILFDFVAWFFHGSMIVAMGKRTKLWLLVLLFDFYVI